MNYTFDFNDYLDYFDNVYCILSFELILLLIFFIKNELRIEFLKLFTVILDISFLIKLNYLWVFSCLFLFLLEFLFYLSSLRNTFPCSSRFSNYTIFVSLIWIFLIKLSLTLSLLSLLSLFSLFSLLFLFLYFYFIDLSVLNIL